MRHNIVHLIRGEAEIEHSRVMDDLANKFGISPFYELMPSHLTLKRGFKMKFENIATLKKVDDKWVADKVWELK